MANTQIDNLSEAIMNELKLYSSGVNERVKEINDECMSEFVKDTKRDAPKGSRNKFYKNITSKTTYETQREKINTWYVKDPEYRLTHLIKNGHATRNGGRTRANDFISSNYEKMEKEYETKVKEAVENGY